MSCSMNEKGETTLEELLEQVEERGLRYPPLILNFFINVLNVEDVLAKSPPQSFVTEASK